MRYPEAYSEFITELMRQKVALIGAVAFRRSREIAGLHLALDGTVIRMRGTRSRRWSASSPPSSG